MGPPRKFFALNDAGGRGGCVATAAMLGRTEEAIAAIHAALLAKTSGVFHQLLAVARPLVINTYRREYYVSSDEHIRLTLDFDLTNYDQWLCARPNLDFKTPHRDGLVMELKCDLPHARQLADVIAAFPQRANAYSKFVTALDAWVGR